MKKYKFLSLIFMFILILSACNNVHTGKVVIDENEKTKEEKINVEYILVDENDKESLIKNIKEGKGAVVDRLKTGTDKQENKKQKEDNTNDR